MWLPKHTYRALLRIAARADARARKAEAALELERHENRTAERHFANMILRKAQSFPLTSQPSPQPSAPRREPTIAERLGLDEGELEALHAEAARLGLPPKEVERRLFAERGMAFSDNEQ